MTLEEIFGTDFVSFTGEIYERDVGPQKPISRCKKTIKIKSFADMLMDPKLPSVVSFLAKLPDPYIFSFGCIDTLRHEFSTIQIVRSATYKKFKICSLRVEYTCVDYLDGDCEQKFTKIVYVVHNILQDGSDFYAFTPGLLAWLQAKPTEKRTAALTAILG